MFRHEDVGRRLCFAQQLAQSSTFAGRYRMHAEIPRPWPVHMQARGGEVDVVPAQRHDSHAAAVKPANDGHDTRAIQAYLGHRSIMSTVRSTALTPNRFRNFWKD